MVAPRALVFRPLVKGNEALGTRLILAPKFRAYADVIQLCRTLSPILVPRGRAPFGQHQESRPLGCFPFSQKFRKFRFGAKWKTFFRFARLENSQKKWNCSKGSPVFPVGTSQWKFVFHLQNTSSMPFAVFLSGQGSLGSVSKNGG